MNGTNKLYQSVEGRIFLIGLAMVVGLIAIISITWINEPSYGKSLTLAFFAHSLGGRAAGVGLCIMSGISTLWNTAYNFYLEVLIVCFTYSLFVLSINHRIQFAWTISITRNLMEKASKHTKKIEKFGWIGLFLFVMIPLPVTGPVVGAIIGFMLRMSIWRNMSAVLLGTLTAIIAWVYCFQFLDDHLHMIQYFLVVVIGIVLFFHLKTIKSMFTK